MAKLAKKMESTHVNLYTWLATFVAAGVLAYAGYWYYKKYRVENARHGIKPIAPQITGGTTLSKLKSKCWESYVELEKLRSLKSKCAKVVGGDIGITTAMSQLNSILNSGKGNEYMAPRIIGQVCDFLINMGTANKMMDNKGNFIMPQANPNLRDERSYFDNIHTLPAEQATKYEAVIKYQTKELQSERSDMRFVSLLQELLPSLQVVSHLAKDENQLSANEIVAEADDFYNRVTAIIKKYEFTR